ncbi:MAG: arsenate reductase family protein [Flavobacteriales bacterium]|nr:arsenate reductase family protein [Flavobacteriales bacterium]
MKKIKIFHNNRCSKSRQALALVRSLTNEVEVIDYMNNTMTKDMLVKVLQDLEMCPSELLRKGESDYKQHVKGKDLSDDQIVDLMLTYPKLIERPIVVNNGKAIVARPPELVNDFVGK